MKAAFLALAAAPVARLAHALADPGEWALFASSALWAGAFLVFLLRYGPLLLAPSLEGSAAALWGPRPKFN
jgi:uncharacterized protein involved in response to NO